MQLRTEYNDSEGLTDNRREDLEEIARAGTLEQICALASVTGEEYQEMSIPLFVTSSPGSRLCRTAKGTCLQLPSRSLHACC